ncbi:hypothetical protein FA95DRAFT_1306535 [Auriscalpium vulgare]|uniref:Uncharacterized protein n=1 Tax=Auriscalpium vulgare TaxID=40419 RepID=A0ACB8R332_9AGAM|nr:hypothetical protein FA95DRAFT_1306535 [Auriscalpium vulgare]
MERGRQISMNVARHHASTAVAAVRSRLSHSEQHFAAWENVHLIVQVGTLSDAQRRSWVRQMILSLAKLPVQRYPWCRRPYACIGLGAATEIVRQGLCICGLPKDHLLAATTALLAPTSLPPGSSTLRLIELPLIVVQKADGHVSVIVSPHANSCSIVLSSSLST